MVGPGAERLPARILLGRPPLRVRGAAAPVQVVHVDDLASALALAATRDLPGVYNVAADGWLDAAEARELHRPTRGARAPGRGARALAAAHVGPRHRRRPAGRRALPRAPVGDQQRAVARPRAGRRVHTNADAIIEAVASLPPRDTGPAIVAGAGGLLLGGRHRGRAPAPSSQARRRPAERSLEQSARVARLRRSADGDDRVENSWWIAEWGNPCRECGFDWAQSPESVIAAVEELPAKFDALLAGRTGDETASDAHPGEPIWSAKAYVFHVADNLRIFAERLEGVFAGAPTTLAAYDQDELAAARDYEAMSLQSALWSVRTATGRGPPPPASRSPRPFTYQHAERGRAQRGRDHARSRARRAAPLLGRHPRGAVATASTRRVELVVGVVVVHRRAVDRRRARAPRSRSARSRWSTPRC